MTPKSLIEPARHAGTALLRSQTDARLVDLTRDGNERAFEAIVHRYHRPLLRYCSRILSPTRAEDAVQQAFLSAHRSIHAGDSELNLRPWLYRIAHNSALNMLRQSGFDHEEMSEEIDGVDTPPQIFERGERLRTVVAAVRELPERQRDAIVLQAMEGRSYDEIAAELGVSGGAVRQLLNRARNTLREAAAAVTPTGLITRIAAGGDGSVADRVGQVVSGAGGGALLFKAGATLVVAGAVAGGAVTGALPVPGGHHQGATKASAATPPQTPGGGSSSGGVARNRIVIGPDGRAHVVPTNVRTVANRGGASGGGGPNPARPGGRRGASGGNGTSGPGGGGSGGGSGGRGGGDGGGGGVNSGSGSSGSSDGGDRSGSGSSGSGDGGSGSSGSGSSGSGTSVSSDGGGSSGPGSSGSSDGGTSGSDGGGDHSGSGSSGSGETVLASPTTSGTDGSGSGDSGSSSDGGSGSSGSGTTH